MMHGDPDDPAAPETRAEILFCPFCRDGFEGRLDCPEHELALVPIDRLPRPNRPTEVASSLLDPRLGRGPVLLGVLLTMVGFFLPFVRVGALEPSALEVAIDGARNLWLTPGAALATLAVLWFRRERQTMRSARAAVLGLAAAGLLPVWYTGRRVTWMAKADGADIDWLAGAVVMALGLLVSGAGSIRLGLPSKP